MTAEPHRLDEALNSDVPHPSSFILHPSAARLAFALGFALPWRIALPVGGGVLHPSLFDLLILPCVIRIATTTAPPLPRPGLRSLPLVLFAVLAVLGLRPDAPVAAFATAWAALTGLALARFDAREVLRGLEWGAAGSALAALVILPFAPEAVTEGGRFAALVGTKNGFAALAGFLAIRRAMAGGRRDLLLSLAWFGMLLMTGGRGANLAALGAGMLLVIGRRFESAGRWRRLLWLVILAAAALLALAGTTFPSDRYEFASEILTHWRHTPLFGIGAGSNYGLDLYFKSFLEFGWIGAGLLAIILMTALRNSATRPLVVFLLLFGIAHDPTRWPLFWFLAASGGRPNSDQV